MRRRRRRRRSWWGPFHLAALLLSALAARATTVTPPTFPQLVADAQVIAQGTVTSVSSKWIDSPQGRVIETYVDFAVSKVLKGSPSPTLTLQFLGGTIGSDSLHVAGMPQFKVGDTEILFVRDNGVQFCPLVRLMHGRYRVRTDASTHRQFVARDDYSPLNSTADVERPMADDGNAAAFRSAANALTPDDFEAQVAAEVAHPSR